MPALYPAARPCRSPLPARPPSSPRTGRPSHLATRHGRRRSPAPTAAPIPRAPIGVPQGVVPRVAVVAPARVRSSSDGTERNPWVGARDLLPRRFPAKRGADAAGGRIERSAQPHGCQAYDFVHAAIEARQPGRAARTGRRHSTMAPQGRAGMTLVAWPGPRSTAIDHAGGRQPADGGNRVTENGPTKRGGTRRAQGLPLSACLLRFVHAGRPLSARTRHAREEVLGGAR